MATKIAKKIKNKMSYPWKLWMDGSTYVAKKGVDFRMDVESFRQSLYRIASKYKLRIDSEMDVKKGTVSFSFTKTDESTFPQAVTGVKPAKTSKKAKAKTAKKAVKKAPAKKPAKTAGKPATAKKATKAKTTKPRTKKAKDAVPQTPAGKPEANGEAE